MPAICEVMFVLKSVSYQRIFFRRLILVNMLQSLTLSITGMIDNAVAGQFWGSEGLAAMKLAMPVYSVLSLFGSVITAGMSLRTTQEMENGQKEEANQIFLCSCASCLLISLIFLLSGLFLARPMARFFAGEILETAILEAVEDYLRPILLGSVCIIFFSLFSAVVMLEGSTFRIWCASFVILAADIAGDLAAVRLNTGIGGIAVASVLSYLAALLALMGHFFHGHSFFHLGPLNFHVGRLKSMLMNGSPMAVRYICSLLCPLVINRLMVRYGTVSGLVALSIQDAVHYLPEAYCKGIASSMLLLTGIYAAEQNREDLSTERRHFLHYALLGGSIFAAALSLAAPLLMHLFTSDRDLQALGTTAFRWYLLGVPFVGVNLGMISYCHGMGKHILAWRLTILHTLILPCLVTALLARWFGITGIYAAFAVHEILLTLGCLASLLLMKREARLSLIGGKDWDTTRFSFERRIHDFADVIAASESVMEHCREGNISQSQAVHTALCLEELGINSIQHNAYLKHPLHLTVRFVIGEKWLILRLRDNGIPYDLTSRYGMLNPDDTVSHIGLRLVFASADDVRYSHFLNLNNVCIRVAVQPSAGNPVLTEAAES